MTAPTPTAGEPIVVLASRELRREHRELPGGMWLVNIVYRVRIGRQPVPLKPAHRRGRHRRWR